MRLTRRYRFAASHRLDAPRLSPEENAAVYGKCNNPYGHGHDYVLEVSLHGPVDAETGRVADVALLDRLVGERVLGAYDHKNMNLEIPVFQHTPPTTENVAADIHLRLRDGWETAFPAGGPRLEAVRILETKRNSVEVQNSNP